MSVFTHFPLFSSIRRRIGEKLGSTKKYVLEFIAIDDFNSNLDRKPANVRHFYVKLRYYLPEQSSRMKNEIFKEFNTRREVNDFIEYYSKMVHVKTIIRGVILK